MKRLQCQTGLSEMEQLLLGKELGPCGCWQDVEPVSGIVLAVYCCGDCIARALDFLEDMLYIDKVHSVSAPTETEDDYEWLG